ncbi:MAG TPA: hypothetical protein VHS32_28105 [Streptosporangiaceae bacterium]|nr:hypothetical protein [Streptosporangiaceae bacterium]
MIADYELGKLSGLPLLGCADYPFSRFVVMPSFLPVTAAKGM